MKPHLEAFTVREENDQTYWTRIGVAFPIQSGGFSVLLDAMPASKRGRYTIVVRPPKSKPASQDRTGADEPGYPE